MKLLDDFAVGEIGWIHEFQTLAERMPPADKMLIRNLRGNATTSGGRMVIIGSASHNDSIATLESQLRDEQHRVVRDDSRQVGEKRTLSLEFSRNR